MKIGILGLLFLGVTQICSAQFSLRSGQSVTVACDNTEEKVVQTALQLFAREDRKSTRLNSSHRSQSRMPSSA